MIGNDHVRFGPEAVGKGPTGTSPTAYRNCRGTGRHMAAQPGSRTGEVADEPVWTDTESTDLIAEQRTLNLRVRGSSPWRRTPTELGILDDIESAQCSFWDGLRSVGARMSRSCFPVLVDRLWITVTRVVLGCPKRCASAPKLLPVSLRLPKTPSGLVRLVCGLGAVSMSVDAMAVRGSAGLAA